MRTFSKLALIIVSVFGVSCSRVDYSTDTTSVATSSVSSEDLSALTGAHIDWISIPSATDGLCTISADFRIITYTPNDPAFTGTDSCAYQSDTASVILTMNFDYTVRPAQASVATGSGGNN